MASSGTNRNTQRRVERLVSAWEQAKQKVPPEPAPAAEMDADVVWNPSTRTRTPLTDKEVEAIRTLRDSGESALLIAKRFGVHRMTVWTHTKDLLS